mmetsp:Transcript_3810/g.9308  ORF Transcript_3810/g.9308 Transcript_3810/m.9308 type:complete len:248 (-) Transcript_3810:152-895(-)
MSMAVVPGFGGPPRISKAPRISPSVASTVVLAGSFTSISSAGSTSASAFFFPPLSKVDMDSFESASMLGTSAFRPFSALAFSASVSSLLPQQPPQAALLTAFLSCSLAVVLVPSVTPVFENGAFPAAGTPAGSSFSLPANTGGLVPPGAVVAATSPSPRGSTVPAGGAAAAGGVAVADRGATGAGPAAADAAEMPKVFRASDILSGDRSSSASIFVKSSGPTSHTAVFSAQAAGNSSFFSSPVAGAQ